MSELSLIVIGFALTVGLLLAYMYMEYRSWGGKHYDSFWQYFKAMFTGKF
jgi:hypothetical protein